MSQLVIASLLETRLKSLAPTFPTAYENIDFRPTVKVPYQSCFLLPSIPNNSTIGQTHFIELGLFQINLYYPNGTGAKAGQTKAEAIKAHFKRGVTMQDNDIMLVITDTPRIAPAFTSDVWYVVPVTLNYQADIFT